MPSTHQPCWRDGVYQSCCCGSEITLTEGSPVPRCQKCNKVTGWLPVKFIQVDYPHIRVSPSTRKQMRASEGGTSRRRHLAARGPLVDG